MKKKILFSLILILNVIPISDVVASTKSSLVITAFANYLDSVNSGYSSGLSNAASTYEPQIKASQNKLIAAQAQFLNVNQVTILKTTSYSSSPPIVIDAVNCPTTHADCKSVVKSKEFISGEISTIYEFVGGVEAFTKNSFIQMNTGILQIIDSQIKDNLIKLNNPSGYNEAIATIRFETSNLDSLNKQYENVKNSLAFKRDTGLMVEPSILAAERAAKNSSNFDKAFVAALKFEQNRIRLNEIARAPWTYINSLKSLNSAIKVTRLSENADSVADNYSFINANKINTSCGTVFTSENEFKETFTQIAVIYKQATKTSIKL